MAANKSDRYLSSTRNGIQLNVLVLPRSSQNAIVGLHGDAIKIKIKAPPVDGAANAMCIKYLAKRLGLSRSELKITSGLNQRNKRVVITPRHASPQKIRARITALIAHNEK